MQPYGLKYCCEEESHGLLNILGVKRKAQGNTSDGGEPPEKCQAVDGEEVPLTHPGTSQDGDGLLSAVPSTSQDGGVRPLPIHSTLQDLPPAMPGASQPGTTVQQSSEELQYALLGHTWGAGTMLLHVCAQRRMNSFTFFQHKLLKQTSFAVGVEPFFASDTVDARISHILDW